MEKTVSRGQALELVSRFGTQIFWDQLSGDRVQKAIELSPEEFGKRFTAFLNNGCRLNVGAAVSLQTKPFNPTEFIGKDWTTWKGPIDGDGLSGEEDIDQRSLALTEVELSTFLFETCFLAGEKLITGDEKLRRLKEKTEFIRFGGNVFVGLWEDYKTHKENSILEWLHKNFGVNFMDFMGQVLRDPLGSRGVLCLDRGGGGEWDWGCGWLGGRWGADDPSAGCAG